MFHRITADRSSKTNDVEHDKLVKEDYVAPAEQKDFHFFWSGIST